MVSVIDGPASSRFHPLALQGNVPLTGLSEAGLSEGMAAAAEHAPGGEGVSWGIPFAIADVLVLKDEPVTVQVAPTRAQWLVFLHTSDARPAVPGPGGIISPMHGEGRLAEHAADYFLLYDDGTEARAAIRRRHHLGTYQRRWGENCFQAVPHLKQRPARAHHEQVHPVWGLSQTRVDYVDSARWMNWLWAWENPHPEKAITGLRFEPRVGVVVISAVSAGDASSQPLRWQTRRKAVLTLPEGEPFCPKLDEMGLLTQVRLDMGQVISAAPRWLYPHESWSESYNNQLPQRSEREVLVEYTAHADACFYLSDGRVVPVAEVERGRPGAREPIRKGAEAAPTPPAFAQEMPLSGRSPGVGARPAGSPDGLLVPVPPATQRVTLRVIERGSGKAVAVKLHVHGAAGEYLAPVDRHRIPNAAWFEDYSVDFAHLNSHYCTYIPGETTIDLPLGQVYIEVSKGFEIRPVRRVVEVTPATREINVEVEKVLLWREKGWVTADTHVHFLSPLSARLEGEAEGVNVVNLLASQWGELMTNVGDFDGRNTWGSRETGGDGEYLLRVGTENRQHVLGHISLLGYSGRIIAPMTSGGPDESALGDPVDVLLTEWARQCKKQGGLVVLPHFPNPRAEHAASIVGGDIDAVEMTSWGNLYGGIDPYSLSDWYRYLNCGYLVAAVGGTDKMSANTAVGTVRTYAHIDPQRAFDYEAWKESVRRAETFVTYGPLLEFAVDGRPMGSRIAMTRTGGTVDVTWQAASVTIPMTRAELVVNGEIRESLSIDPWEASGSWRVHVDKSAWLALLIRGHYADRPEIVAAHSSPVMVDVEGTQLLAAADALTILEQIEGALAYLDTVGTRAEDAAYKRMRLVLEGAHRVLHNRMHRMGYYHDHTVAEDHPEHH